MSVKESVIQAISRLPEDIDFKDIANEVAFLAALQEAEHDIDQDRLLSNDEAKRRLDSWITN